MAKSRDLEEDPIDPALYQQLLAIARQQGLDLTKLKRAADQGPDPTDPRAMAEHLPDDLRDLVLDPEDLDGEDDALDDALDDDPDLPDYAHDGDRIAAGQMKRSPGKPRKGQEVPWEAIEHLLVFGEPYQFQGRTLVRYPTHGELAKRFNVHVSSIDQRSKRKKLSDRRASVQQRVSHEVEDIIVTEHAACIAHGRERMLSICDALIDQFEALVRAKKIRIDSVADFNTVMRLREFVSGGPDQRGQMDHVLKLEDIQERHRAANAARVIDLDTAGQPMLGVVDERVVQKPGGTWEIHPSHERDDPGAILSDRERARAERDAPAEPRARVEHRTEPEPPPEPRGQAIDVGYIKTHDVVSQNIAELGYDDARAIMEVVFHDGSVWRYKVPRSTYDEIDNAGSVGRAFDQLVKRAGVQGTKVVL